MALEPVVMHVFKIHHSRGRSCSLWIQEYQSLIIHSKPARDRDPVSKRKERGVGRKGRRGEGKEKREEEKKGKESKYYMRLGHSTLYSVKICTAVKISSPSLPALHLHTDCMFLLNTPCLFFLSLNFSSSQFHFLRTFFSPFLSLCYFRCQLQRVLRLGASSDLSNGSWLFLLGDITFFYLSL